MADLRGVMMRLWGRAVWRSLSIRRLGGRTKAALYVAGRAGAIILALAAGSAVIAATPDLWPRLVYWSAALSSPSAALEAMADRWTDRPPESSADMAPETEESALETEESVPETEDDAARPADEHDDGQELEDVSEVPPERRGTVLTEQYVLPSGGIYVPFGAAHIRNGTAITNEEVATELAKPLELGLEHGADGPQVLIFHTHTTERYEPADRGYFDLDYVWRSKDASLNMAAVGDVVAEGLSARGVSVIHDTTLHDWPSYNGSYARSAETVSAYLSLYPSIKVVLDLHRDAIEPEQGVIVKPTAVIDGRNAAQLMVLCGCDDGTMNMPGYFSNLRFAAALSDRLESKHPGLTRPVMFSYHKYNMDLSPGLLLIEIGASGNTLSEAKYSGELLAEALADLLVGV